MNASDERTVSRRAVLKASAGTVGLPGVGTESGRDGGSSGDPGPCSETTVRPSTVSYGEPGMPGCSDDHPATRELHCDVASSLENRFPTVGSLIEAGFVPYFDFFTAEGASAWSHWLSPAFLDDDSVLDPARPESVLVDHRWWRPIGVMFVATRDGDRVHPPPTVYGDADAGDACRPWHAHVGLPGRYSWWKFRAAYGEDVRGVTEGLPCRTPWVMHVWAYPHPETRYAHGAPPRGHRGGPPAEDAGFETNAVPGEDALGPAVLPDAVRHRFERLI